MLSKVLTVVKSKAALVALGVVLVGGGAVAAYAATNQQNASTGTHANATGKSNATGKPGTTHDASGKHDHTVSIEGVLKSYNAGAGTISVQSQDGESATTVVVNAETRINGDAASALADLAKTIGHRVQVKADKQDNGTLVAWKVTVQGTTADASGDSNDD